MAQQKARETELVTGQLWQRICTVLGEDQAMTAGKFIFSENQQGLVTEAKTMDEQVREGDSRVGHGYGGCVGVGTRGANSSNLNLTKYQTSLPLLGHERA